MSKNKTQDGFDLAVSSTIIPKDSVELMDLEELEDFSIAKYKQEKQSLEIKRKNLMLRLDGRKLNQAVQIVDAMDMTLGRILEGYSKEDVPALDLKALTEAYERLAKSLGMISRMDSIDGSGTAARINIEIKQW